MFADALYEEPQPAPGQHPVHEASQGEAGVVPEDDEITQEDAWAVITAFFEEKGLVRQQLDSFNEFVTNTMQEIIDESNEIVVRPEAQYTSGPGEEHGAEEREYKINFGQIYLSKPLLTEADDDTSTLFPKEARLRNLTWVMRGLHVTNQSRLPQPLPL